MGFAEDRSVLSLASRAPDREIRYGEDALHVADVWESRPANGGPLVVLIHGGFWRPAFDRKHLGPFANSIADAGFTVASIEYRRIPGQPDLMTDDVSLACRRVPTLLNARRAVAIGHSAGGHLALFAAATVPSDAMSYIGLAPVASLVMAEAQNLGSGAAAAFLGAEARTRRDLDPLELPSPASRVSIVHGVEDEIVPKTLSEAYQRKHPATRVVTVPDAGHFALIDPRTPAFATILAEIKRLS